MSLRFWVVITVVGLIAVVTGGYFAPFLLVAAFPTNEWREKMGQAGRHRKPFFKG